MFLQDLSDKYGMLHESKMMHLSCIYAGYVVVTQEMTTRLLKLLDPLGQCGAQELIIAVELALYCFLARFWKHYEKKTKTTIREYSVVKN